MMNSRNYNNILLVSSLSDPAGSLIHEEIKKILPEYPEREAVFSHRQFPERLIYIDGPSLQTDADCIIFLSRHASREPRPVLTVHVTGNFGQADFGGEPGCLTPAATGMMHAIMNRLAEEVPDGYAVTYEATHHGPTRVPVPSCFVEVGSTESEWHDRNAASAVARAVIHAVPGDVIPLAGFGGTHYAKRETDITLTTRGGFGHIMPTRDLPHLNRELFQTIISNSGAEAVYIDRKSVARQDIITIEGYAASLDIPVVGQSDLAGIGKLSFQDYVRIQRYADDLLPGCTLHIHGISDASHLKQIPIPADLIAEAEKTDSAALSEGLDLLPVARMSGNGIAFYPVFITNQENITQISDDLIHLCVSILLRTSECRVAGDYLIIRKPRFDPVRARELGVLAGPDYGKLMAGHEIQVQGIVVTPDMVMNYSEKKICIRGQGNQ